MQNPPIQLSQQNTLDNMITAKFAVSRVPLGRQYFARLHYAYDSEESCEFNDFWSVTEEDDSVEGVGIIREIYVRDNHIVQTPLTEMGLSLLPKIVLTMDSPIVAACFAQFSMPHPYPFVDNQTVNSKESNESPHKGLAVFESNTMMFFTEEGEEFHAKLPVEVGRVWPVRYSLLLEGKVPNMTSSEGGTPRMTLFIITHPLSEITPIYFRIPDGQGKMHSVFCMDGHMKIVHADVHLSIVIMLDTRRRKHSVWLLRPSIPSEYDNLIEIRDDEYAVASSVFEVCRLLGCNICPTRASEFGRRGSNSPLKHVQVESTYASHYLWNAGDSMDHSCSYLHEGPKLQNKRIAQVLKLEHDKSSQGNTATNRRRSLQPQQHQHVFPLFSLGDCSSPGPFASPSKSVLSKTLGSTRHSISPFVDRLSRLRRIEQGDEKTTCTAKAQHPFAVSPLLTPRSFGGHRRGRGVEAFGDSFMHSMGFSTTSLRMIAYDEGRAEPQILEDNVTPLGEPLIPTSCLELIWMEEDNQDSMDNHGESFQMDIQSTMTQNPRQSTTVQNKLWQSGTTTINLDNRNNLSATSIKPSISSTPLRPMRDTGVKTFLHPSFALPTPITRNKELPKINDVYNTSNASTFKMDCSKPRKEREPWGFLAQELCPESLQTWWACYSAPDTSKDASTTSRVLVCRILKLNSTATPHWVMETSNRTVKLPMQDAAYLKHLKMILLLDRQDRLFLYSGVTKICQLGITPVPPNVDIEFPCNFPLIGMASARPTAASQRLLTPAPLRSNASYGMPDTTSGFGPQRSFLSLPLVLPPMTFELGEVTGRAFTLFMRSSDNDETKTRLIRFTLPDMTSHPLVVRCFATLEKLLPRSVCHRLMIQWYTEQNAPGLCSNRLLEWSYFLRLLLQCCGIYYEWHDELELSVLVVGTMPLSSHVNTLPTKRHRVHKENDNANTIREEWKAIKRNMQSSTMNSLLDQFEILKEYNQETSQKNAKECCFRNDNEREAHRLKQECYFIDKIENADPNDGSPTSDSYEDRKINELRLVWRPETVNTILVCHIPQIAMAMHLLYEEIKLDRTFIPFLFDLSQLALTLCSLLHWDGYVDAYLRSHSELFSWYEKCLLLRKQAEESSNEIYHCLPKAPLNMVNEIYFDSHRPPLVSSWLCKLFRASDSSQQGMNSTFGDVKQFPIVTKELSRCTTLLVEAAIRLASSENDLQGLHESRYLKPLIDSGNAVSFLNYEKPAWSSSSFRNFVSFLSDLSKMESTSSRNRREDWLSHLPPAVALLFRSALNYCRDDPPPNCSLSVFELLGRHDFVRQFQLLTACKDSSLLKFYGRSNESSAPSIRLQENADMMDSSFTRRVVEYWYRSLEPHHAWPEPIKLLREHDYSCNPSLAMQLEADVAAQFAFKDDLRLREACRLLLCPINHIIHLPPHLILDTTTGQNDAQVNEEINYVLLAKATRASSQPVGRGMLYLRCHHNTNSPGINLSCLWAIGGSSDNGQWGTTNGSASRNRIAVIPSNIPGTAGWQPPVLPHGNSSSSRRTTSNQTGHLIPSMLMTRAVPPHMVPVYMSIQGTLYIDSVDPDSGGNNTGNSGINTAISWRHNLPNDSGATRRYAAFHMGVAEALQFAPHMKLNCLWLLDNTLETDSILEAERAGVLLGLGLAGHLRDLPTYGLQKYLGQKNDMTNMAILLGLCCHRRGQMDQGILRVLAVHFRPMYPTALVELDPMNLSHAASMLGLGMLYQSSGSIHLAQLMLNEIASPVCVEDEEGRVSVSSNALALTAGFALGLIMLQRGNDTQVVNVNGTEIRLMDQLHNLMVAGPRVVTRHLSADFEDGINPAFCGSEHYSNREAIILEDVPDVVGVSIPRFAVGGEAGPIMAGYETTFIDAGFATSGRTGAGLVSGGVEAIGGSAHPHYRRRYLYGDVRIGREGRSKRYHAKVIDGTHYNVDVTSPGATIALGLCFFDGANRRLSGAKVVAEWMECPSSAGQLVYVRPHHLRLRTISYGLVTWSNIRPTDKWLHSLLPTFLQKYMPSRFGNGQDSNTAPDVPNLITGLSLADKDEEGMKTASLNILGGSFFVLGLKYAGTHDEETKKYLIEWCHYLLVDPTFQNGSNKESQANVVRPLGLPQSQWNEAISMALLSLGMVMSGSGDIHCLRYMRLFRIRLHGQLLRTIRRRRARPPAGNSGTTSPSQASTITWIHERHFGCYQTLHMAIGLLFLGAGRLSLSNRMEDVAMLFLSFYPDFPQHADDQLFYLQALRNMYTLAVKPSRLTAIDLETNRPVSSQLQLVHKKGVLFETDFVLSWRDVLPMGEEEAISKVDYVELCSPNYWSMRFHPGTQEWQLLRDSFYKGGYIYMMPKKNTGSVMSLVRESHHLATRWLDPYVNEYLTVFLCGLRHVIMRKVHSRRLDGKQSTVKQFLPPQAQELSDILLHRFLHFKPKLKKQLILMFSKDHTTGPSPVSNAFILWFQIFYRKDLQELVSLMISPDGSLRRRGEILRIYTSSELRHIPIESVYMLYSYLSAA